MQEHSSGGGRGAHPTKNAGTAHLLVALFGVALLLGLLSDDRLGVAVRPHVLRLAPRASTTQSLGLRSSLSRSLPLIQSPDYGD